MCNREISCDSSLLNYETFQSSTPFFNSSYTKHSLFASLPRCRQSTMPPHRLFPPPCPDKNIRHIIHHYIRNAVLVIQVIVLSCGHPESIKGFVQIIIKRFHNMEHFHRFLYKSFGIIQHFICHRILQIPIFKL